MKNTIVLILLLFLGFQGVALDAGYKITIKFKGASDTALYLAHYFGNKQYLDDTAYRNRQGYFVFEGSEALHQGMYIVAGAAKNKYFDFFVTTSQEMEFVCDPENIVLTMQVKGSDDNKAFYSYIKYLGAKQKQVEPLSAWLKSNRDRKGISDSIALMTAKVDAIDADAKNYIRNFYTSNPDYLSARFVKASNEPEYLSLITSPDGKVDSSKIYITYKAHYFDNIAFNDARLLYTPVFTQKIDFYFDKLVVPLLDSMEVDLDRVLTYPGIDKEVQTYLAWFLSLKFESSQIMGHDALFVYIVRKYLEPGKIDWQYPEVKPNIIKRVNALEPLLLGKPAPNLILLDTMNVPHSLLATPSRYTLLFFWESTCGHCKQEMPKVIKFYEEYHKKYGLEIFAVSTDTNMVKWKAFIQKNNLPWVNVNGHLSLSGNYHDLYDIRSTPVMYLLDENKKILTKLLLEEEIGNVIRNREESLEKEKAKNKKP
jgi:thiol-disulfide isomerase/thioredoxin